MDSIERHFGPYIVEVTGNHAVIRREDGGPCEPSFYEMQHLKCMAFGGPAVGVEVFPAIRHLVDGQNQRHLWNVDPATVPNLHTGHGVQGQTVN